MIRNNTRGAKVFFAWPIVRCGFLFHWCIIVRMTIVVDDSVWVRLNGLLKKGEFLRVGIESGGCYGFQYTFAVDTARHVNDVVWNKGDLSVVVKEPFLPFLDGGTLYFEQDMMSSQFVFHNPSVTDGCGCGVSFAIPKGVS